MSVNTRAFPVIALLFILVGNVYAPLPEYIPALGENYSRDDLIVMYFSLGLNYSEIVSFLLCHGIQICLRQLKRVLRTRGLQRRKRFTPIQDVVDAIEEEIRGSGCSIGYRLMHQRLQNDRGLVVDRETVRQIIKGLDPEGVDSRSRRKSRRRMYFAKGPNFIWHTDGYVKLKPFGFCINGAIDGYSRRIMWLEVGPSNNNPRITAQYFIDCIRQVKGVPRVVRGDCGTENTYIAAIQRYLRKDCDDGKSVANQRIEAWWSLLRKTSTSCWMNFFKDMRDVGLFKAALTQFNLTVCSFVLRHSFKTSCTG